MSEKIINKIFNHNLSFHTINIAGWVCYLLWGLLTLPKVYYGNIKTIMVVCVLYLSGYLTSIILALIYKKLKNLKMSLIKLGLLIVILSIVFAFVWHFLDFSISLLFYSSKELLNNFSFTKYLFWIKDHTIILFAWSSVYFLGDYWKKFETEKLRHRETIFYAQQAELQILRSQLNPHFLFNSLNSVKALILEDADRARDMISELAEFYKYSLFSKNFSVITLKQELEAVTHYLEIEKIRFRDKIEINYEIQKEAEDFKIPVLLLHPIIENAVKYGMETSDLPLKININIGLDKENLIIVISNTGRIPDEKDGKSLSNKGTKIGLENLRKRLELTYPGNYFFELKEENGKVVVYIIIKRG